MVSRSTLLLLTFMALAFCALLAAANLYFGDLNQDEGWYLYAAAQMLHGHWPYRDFAFSQGPVMPLAYIPSTCLVERWGLAGGRLYSVGLAWLGMLLAGALAARTVRRGARWYAFLLVLCMVGVNVYHSYFTTIVKTYAIASLLLVAGLLALSYAHRRGALVACALSGLLLAAAAGVRLSAGIVLPIAGVYLLVHRNRIEPRGWLAFGLGGALGLLLVFGPFFALAPKATFFWLVEYHGAREAGHLMSLLAYKAGFISRFVHAYLVPVLACLGLLLLKAFRLTASPEEPNEDTPPSFLLFLWVVGLAVSFIHFAAPFPYDDYQVFVAPVLAAALAGSWGRVWHGAFRTAPATDVYKERPRSPAALAFLLFMLLGSATASCSSPINQDWFVAGRDRIWWKLKDQSAICQLRSVGRQIRALMPLGGRLLTQDIYLAVEAGCAVPAGLEMGPFSYFPDISTERAEQLGVLNHERMVALLRQGSAPVAALSGYSLSIASPGVQPLSDAAQQELWGLLRQRYDEVAEVPGFGQARTTLTLLKLKPEEPPAP